MSCVCVCVRFSTIWSTLLCVMECDKLKTHSRLNITNHTVFSEPLMSVQHVVNKCKTLSVNIVCPSLKEKNVCL